MNPRKQFQSITREECLSPVDSVSDNFMPEMSMSVKDILSQFAFVDNVRLQDLMKRGYDSQDDDSDFDYPDFDALDIAEKEELYDKAVEFINKYEQEKRVEDQQKHDDAGDSASA